MTHEIQQPVLPPAPEPEPVYDFTLPDDDTKLAALGRAVRIEQERRARLAAAPAQIAEQARRYIADGGEAQAVVDAVTAAVEPAPPAEAEPASVDG